jgi:D-xylulose reductase
MQAVVLEEKGVINVREIDLPQEMGPKDVRIAIHTVGVCGSDVHYYEYGSIGPFVVREPMVLGHEAAGTVIEVGSDVRNLKQGDRVCMEPGIPDPNSRASRLGMYNLDPAVVFWATPPVHGCLAKSVVHPADYTFKLPENVSFGEGALVEPLAIGIHAANKAQIKPGDVAVVIGAGTIGIVTAMAALAGGCSTVIMSDIQGEKLEMAAKLGSIMPVDVTRENLKDVVMQHTEGWGADLIFEASGSDKAAEMLFDPLCPGGRVVYIGMPGKAVPIDITAAQIKEASLATIFRYANVYPRALALMGSGKIDLKPLITERYRFDKSVDAFDYALNRKPTSVKIQIELA